MIHLRPYQNGIINEARGRIRSGFRSILITSPVGSGKTVMFSFFASSVSSKGKRTLILAHRDELLDQISDTLLEFKVDHSFVAPNRHFDPENKVQIASVFSMVRRLGKIPPPDVIVIDEAHHAIAGSTWSRVMDHFSGAIRIGVTATPERLSGEPLRDMFSTLIIGPSVSALMASGYLSQYKLYAPSTIDTSRVHTRGGDFNKEELSQVVDKPTVTGNAIREYKRLADGKRAIVFCVSIEHTHNVAAMFRGAGYVSCGIDGKMDIKERREIVDKFRRGEIQVLTSCDIISEGFDLPAIECAIMLRPTQSLALWIQQTGRALRPYPGKERAIILDHAGNCERHGLPDEQREWSLDGRKKAKKGERNNVRVCPACFAAQIPGRAVCQYCGFAFPLNPREVVNVDGTLTEIDPLTFQRHNRREQGRAQTMEELVRLGRSRGYKNPHGWAYFIIKSRKGVRNG